MVEAVAVACTPTRTDRGTSAMNVDPEPDATQQVMKPATKKRREDDVTREMMEGAAQKKK